MFPTFLEAAGLKKPSHVQWDGMSLLAALTKKAHDNAPAGSSGSSSKETPKLRGTQPLEQQPQHSQAQTQRALTNEPDPSYPSSVVPASVAIADAKAATAATVAANTANSNSNTNSSKHEHHSHHRKNKDDHWGFTTDGRSYNRRVFLWHKDTEIAAHGQDRYQSSGWYDEMKLTTTGRQGCLDRVFDLKHDPYEKFNMIGGSKCRVQFSTGVEQLKAQMDTIVRKNVFEGHCKAQGHDGATVQPCVEKYVNAIIEKVQIVFPQLVRFVSDGNAPMVTYMNERYKNATCKVPKASDIQGIQY